MAETRETIDNIVAEKRRRRREVSEEVIVTSEFVKNAKHLYRTALRYAKANYACMGKQSYETSDEVVKSFRLLHEALTRFNYGVDPLTEGGAK